MTTAHCSNRIEVSTEAGNLKHPHERAEGENMKTDTLIGNKKKSEVEPDKNVDREAKPALYVPAFDETWVLAKLRQEINGILDEFGREGVNACEFDSRNAPAVSSSDFHTRLDVRDEKKQITVTAELPGIRANDVVLHLSNNRLTIKGNKRCERQKSRKFHQRERAFGSFNRCVELPCAVSADKTQASLKRGILTVILPKTKHATRQKKQKISIQPG
jgi:HSP20 family protein